jgi:hypothetical protein
MLQRNGKDAMKKKHSKRSVEKLDIYHAREEDEEEEINIRGDIRFASFIESSPASTPHTHTGTHAPLRVMIIPLASFRWGRVVVVIQDHSSFLFVR